VAHNAWLKTRGGNSHWSLRELPDPGYNTKKEDGVEHDFENTAALLF
jgi:hypothetical protein